MKSFFKEINNSMDHLPSQKNFHVPKIVHIIYWLEYEVFLFFFFFLFLFFPEWEYELWKWNTHHMIHIPSQKNFHVPKIVHIIYWLEYEVFLFFSFFFFFCFFLNESVNFESETHITWFTLCFCKKQGPKDSTYSSLCERAKDEGLFWKPIDLHIPVVSGKGLALKTYF